MFLATGKHDLRGWPRSSQGTQNDLVALKMYFTFSPQQQAQLAGYVEIILYDGGYAGLQMVEGDCADLCALSTQKKLKSLEGRWDHLLDHMQRSSPHLARRLSGAVSILERPLVISSIPYGYCAEEPTDQPSLWRLGDQATVIPLFSGDGMASALYTGYRAAQLYLAGSTPGLFHREVHSQFEGRLYWRTVLSRLLNSITRTSCACVALHPVGNIHGYTCASRRVTVTGGKSLSLFSKSSAPLFVLRGLCINDKPFATGQDQSVARSSVQSSL